jgi:hypothetical protein
LERVRVPRVIAATLAATDRDVIRVRRFISGPLSVLGHDLFWVMICSGSYRVLG